MSREPDKQRIKLSEEEQSAGHAADQAESKQTEIDKITAGEELDLQIDHKKSINSIDKNKIAYNTQQFGGPHAETVIFFIEQ